MFSCNVTLKRWQGASRFHGSLSFRIACHRLNTCRAACLLMLFCFTLEYIKQRKKQKWPYFHSNWKKLDWSFWQNDITSKPFIPAFSNKPLIVLTLEMELLFLSARKANVYREKLWFYKLKKSTFKIQTCHIFKSSGG